MKKLHIFFYYWFPIIIYCVLIFIQSSYPSIESVPKLPHMDKVLHFVGYALLGALFLRAFKTSRIKNNLKFMLILSILLSSLYGISDEIHQYLIPYRDADLMDVLADTLGGIMGVYIYQAVAGKTSAG